MRLRIGVLSAPDDVLGAVGAPRVEVDVVALPDDVALLVLPAPLLRAATRTGGRARVVVALGPAGALDATTAEDALAALGAEVVVAGPPRVGHPPPGAPCARPRTRRPRRTRAGCSATSTPRPRASGRTPSSRATTT